MYRVLGWKQSEFQLKILIVFASLAIYIVWLLCFNMTSNKMNNICYGRLRKMEEHAPAPDMFEINMELHGYLLKQVRDVWWCRYLRQTIWVLFLWVLVIVSVFIILF